MHDTDLKTWRHLDFFEHQAYLSARVPRVRCAEHGVHLVNVPWARPGSGFTLLFEVAMLTYARQMPIAPLAKMAREHDIRIWRVIEHHVDKARAGMDFSDVTDIGVDETSAWRGQDYVSIFMDLAARRVMFAAQGREASTVQAFAADLQARGGAPATQVQRVCCDMGPAFIKGTRTHLSSPPRQTDGAVSPTAISRRSCSTAITSSRRPTRLSTRSGGPRPRPGPSSSAAATPG